MSTDPRGDEDDSHGRDFNRQIRSERAERSGDCTRDAHAEGLGVGRQWKLHLNDWQTD
jgi:hypothetical protein